MKTPMPTTTVRSYVIYCHTCRASGKAYVGWATIVGLQAPHDAMTRRWKQHLKLAQAGHGFLLSRAIRRHGSVAWSHEVIDVVSTLAAAKQAERLWIAQRNTCVLDANGHGYNMTRGGDGGQTYLFDAARRKRMSASSSGANNARAKLTTEDVISIRQAYAAGAATQQSIAEQHCIDQVTVSSIVRGESWKGVPVRARRPRTKRALRRATSSWNNRSVIQVDPAGTVVAVHPSMYAATLTLGVSSSSGIAMCCAGARPRAHGYRWAYSTVPEPDVGEALFEPDTGGRHHG